MSGRWRRREAALWIKEGTVIDGQQKTAATANQGLPLQIILVIVAKCVTLTYFPWNNKQRGDKGIKVCVCWSIGLEEGPDAGTYSLQMKPGFWQDCSATQQKTGWRNTSLVLTTSVKNNNNKRNCPSIYFFYIFICGALFIESIYFVIYILYYINVYYIYILLFYKNIYQNKLIFLFILKHWIFSFY